MITILPRWLRDNIGVKLSMFLLATLLWFLVVTERGYEYVLEIPLEAVNLKPSKVVASQLPETVKVRFQASGKELLRMQYVSHPVLKVNLATINFFYKFPLQPEMVLLPGGMEAFPLEVIEPDSIEVILDDKIEVNLPVEAIVKLDIASGYTLVGDLILDPQDVNVTGPRKKLTNLSKINTLPYEVENAKRNTELVLQLETPTEYGISISPQSVKAFVRVERLSEDTIIGIAIKVNNEPRGVTIVIEPSSVDVQLSGASSTLAAIEPADINVWVDHRELNPRISSRVPVHVSADKPVEIKGVSPDKVRLIVRRNERSRNSRN